jgi:hypothetical protein
MVFSFASNFEFSTASISTTCPWSAGVLDSTGLSGAVAVLEAIGFFTHGQHAQGDRHIYASRTRFMQPLCRRAA